MGFSASSGYWFTDAVDSATAIDTLNALRRYRDAERHMRAAAYEDMGMGERDAAAISFLIKAQRSGELIRQRELAEHLQITNASASALVDRLSRSEDLRRVPHPSDRRAHIIEVTPLGSARIKAHMSAMHATMLSAAQDFSPTELAVVHRFLSRLTESVQR